MAVSGRLRSALGVASAMVLLGACARSHEDPHAAPSTTPSTAPAKHHRPYSDVNPPPRRAGDFVVKVLAVSRVEPRDDGHPLRSGRSGPQFWGEQVRTCVKPSSDHDEVVRWKDWRAADANGRTYPARAGGSEPLRTPAYPFHRTLSPGQCVTGWWLITAPKGAVVDAIEFAPDGGSALIEWPTLR